MSSLALLNGPSVTFFLCWGYSKILRSIALIDLFTSDKGGGGKCVCPGLSVCLSVSKITQKRVHGFG